jgi:transposase
MFRRHSQKVGLMDVLNAYCAGLDVHKTTVVACRVFRLPSGKRVSEVRTFGTTTAEILDLGAWLAAAGVTDVAMESTGVYWKPIWNLLEGSFTLMLVNPQHIKQVPGRKTDVRDAEWIATLLEHGLLRPSFVPPAPQRALREMTRTRTMITRQRAEMVNRVQKVLEDANIKLSSVATDVMGVSGRAMIEAMIDGQTDPKVLADLAAGRLRSKMDALEQALLGRMQAHHQIILKQLLAMIDSMDTSIATLDAEIVQSCVPFTEAVARLDTITGVGQATAEMLVSEIGTDMSKFPTAGHLCAWAGVAPGNNESAGKRRSGRTRKGNQSLRTGLIQAAHAAARSKATYLSALYRRLVPHRGKKRAAVAVAHAILTIVYHMITRKTTYQELGGDYFDKLNPKKTATHLIKRVEELGYVVTKKPNELAVAA